MENAKLPVFLVKSPFHQHWRRLANPCDISAVRATLLEARRLLSEVSMVSLDILCCIAQWMAMKTPHAEN
jgi:hypothetical protein